MSQPDDVKTPAEAAQASHTDVTASNKALPSANPDAPAQSDAQHTEDVAEMFGRMARWYDFQNRAFSLFLDCWWRRNLVRSVVPGPTRHVVDLAAGTLDVSLAVLRRYPELRVTATDISEPMLRYGEEHKVRAGERSRITTMVADARQMPMPDACADAITIAFGIRNVR
ncbi:MAG: class I SAM-dependent methyltransferase, partial [Mailhella sp.]|nr:class I SAM-dependent methyltransferase [Mailhella sp.]